MSAPSRELYRSGLLAIGTFRCRPDDDAFGGGWMDQPTLVFPRTCVRITQEGSDTVVADPNTVVLYRGEQEYSRDLVDARGDHCEWFEVDPGWLREAARPYDPAVADPGAPAVRRTHGPASPAAYRLQRSLTRLLLDGHRPDRLLVEEALLRLVDLVIPLSYGPASTATDPILPVSSQHRSLVDDAKAIMAIRFDERLTLEDIGSAVGSSRFHLARTFRRVTGRSLHQYLTALRLRAALGHLEADDFGIAEIAVIVGFSGHSHFTQVFHSAFGLTPSQFRSAPTGLVEELLQDPMLGSSTISTAT